MSKPRRLNPVYRSISRPLTILGAERKLFFFAMCVGAATFNLLGSLLGGLLMFLLLYFIARAMDWGAGNIHRAVADYGTKYIVVAGLLNVVAVVDAYHIAIGKKQ